MLNMMHFDKQEDLTALLAEANIALTMCQALF